MIYLLYSGIGHATKIRVAKKIGKGNMYKAKLVTKIAILLTVLIASLCNKVTNIMIYWMVW